MDVGQVAASGPDSSIPIPSASVQRTQQMRARAHIRFMFQAATSNRLHRRQRRQRIYVGGWKNRRTGIEMSARDASTTLGSLARVRFGVCCCLRLPWNFRHQGFLMCMCVYVCLTSLCRPSGGTPNGRKSILLRNNAHARVWSGNPFVETLHSTTVAS